MEDLLVRIGQRILGRRKQLRLTQKELSELSGLTAQNISTAELGKKAMRLQNIVRLSQALHTSTDYLLFGIINEVDYFILYQKISSLDPTRQKFLENIIDTYIQAVRSKNG